MKFSDFIEQLEGDIGENTRKAALRTCLYFSYGYHLANVSDGTSTEDFIKRMRGYVLDKTGSKSQASARVKTARLVGPRIEDLTEVENLSDGTPLSSKIDQMLNRLERSGIHSVKALENLASHGKYQLLED